MNLLAELGARKTALRPTTTVVRKRDGTIEIERGAELLSDAQQQQLVENSRAAGSAATTVEVDACTAGGLWSFTPESNMWVRENTDVPKVVLAFPLRILNLWFAEFEWEKRHDALLDGILFMASNTQPFDLVLLQEVTPRFLGRLQRDARIRMTYRMTDAGNGATFIGGYGSLMLVHRMLPTPRIQWVKFPGTMGRRGLMGVWGNGSANNSSAVA